MFIDLHLHESAYSPDSQMTLDELVQAAREKGLGAVCITDHDSMGLAEYAKEYSREHQYPVLVGAEFFSLWGDITAFGIDAIPDHRISAQEFIDYVNERNGFCVSCHPFRNNNRGLEEKLMTVKGLDGVEVLNGSTLPEANQKAADYARALGLVTVGASDCHIPEKLGIFATYFPEDVRTMEEFIRVFKSGGCRPAYYWGGEYRLWDMNVAIHKPFKIA